LNIFPSTIKIIPPMIEIKIPKIIIIPEIANGYTIFLTVGFGFEKVSEFSGSSENITNTMIF
jgi:hypothetical protein